MCLCAWKLGVEHCLNLLSVKVGGCSTVAGHTDIMHQDNYAGTILLEPLYIISSSVVVLLFCAPDGPGYIGTVPLEPLHYLILTSLLHPVVHGWASGETCGDQCPYVH